MAERGRRPGFIMSNEHRDKIKNSNILNALIEHVEGKREMSATQVTAGLGLLKKALPDLSAVQISADDSASIEHMSTDELASLLGAIRSLIAEKGGETVDGNLGSTAAPSTAKH